VRTSWWRPEAEAAAQPSGHPLEESGAGGDVDRSLLEPISGWSDELIQALPTPIYTTDAEGRLTSYNEAAVAFWGCRPELGSSEFCGSWRLYWPDGRPMPHDEWPVALALESRRPIRGVEAIAERPDGTRVPFVPYPTPLFDASGRLIGAVNLLVDISERKRVEQSLARHRDEQAALYRFTDRLYRSTTLEDVYQAALDAMRESLGCERASILLFDDAGVMRFVAWRGLSEGYRKAVEGHSPWGPDVRDPEPIHIADVRAADLPSDLRSVINAEGIEALAFIPLVARGRLIGKFMTYRDAPHTFSDAEIGLSLTIARQLGFSIERARAEEERHRAEQTSRLLASIIENSNDSVVSKDLDGIVTSWNHGAERMYGYTAEEMLGRPFTALIPPQLRELEAAALQRVRRGEEPPPYESMRRRKDGSLLDVSVTISPVRDETGRVVGVSKIARDITESKQAQARQELLAREIQHRTKNLFAVVHSIVAKSFAGKQTVQEAEQAVVSRLHSLAQTHAMLVDKEWQGAELAEIVATEMSPFAERVSAAGPRVLLSAKAAQNFALALHELATNAAKYGALSGRNGRIHIAWDVDRAAGAFTFQWLEQGGPPVTPPGRKGFGSVVLEQVMAEYGDEAPQMEFDPRGASYRVKGRLGAVEPPHET